MTRARALSAIVSSSATSKYVTSRYFRPKSKAVDSLDLAPSDGRIRHDKRRDEVRRFSTVRELRLLRTNTVIEKCSGMMLPGEPVLSGALYAARAVGAVVFDSRARQTLNLSWPTLIAKSAQVLAAKW